MERKILLEIERQKKLMGILSKSNMINEAGPGPISSWGGKMIKSLFGTTNYASAKTTVEDLFSKMQSLPSFSKFKNKGIQTLEDFVNDAKNINRVNASTGSVLHKMQDSEYRELAKEMVNLIFKEPNYRPIREGIYQEYKDIIKSKSIIDFNQLNTLENLLKAGDTEGYVALKNSLQGKTPPTFDPNIITHLESKFPRKTPNNDGIWVGLYKSLVKDNTLFSAIKSLYNLFTDQTDKLIDEYFIEYNQIVQDFSNDLANGITKNNKNYITRLDELSRKISKGSNDQISELWKQTKDRLPENMKSRFVNPDGTMDIGQFKEWINYFDGIEKTQTVLQPQKFVTRFDALKRLFTNPPVGEDLSKLQKFTRTQNVAYRVGNFLKRGTFRLKEERMLNEKIIGSGPYKGYQAGELITSIFIYMPAVHALLKTFGDLLERNEMIPDTFLFDKETFTGGEARNVSVKEFLKKSWEMMYKELGLNVDDVTNTFLKGFSPGLYYAGKLWEKLESGGTGPITQTEINEGLKQIEVDSANIKRALISEPDLRDIVEDSTLNNEADQIMNLDSLLNDVGVER